MCGTGGHCAGHHGIEDGAGDPARQRGKVAAIYDELERSNRELQDFAYVASHDLQEPLRKIVVFSERLRERANEALEPESRDYLERMQKAASRMQNLINGLLTFSRVTTKAKPFEQVDLAKVASEVVADLEGRIELAKGRVEVGRSRSLTRKRCKCASCCRT